MILDIGKYEEKFKLGGIKPSGIVGNIGTLE